MLVLVVIASIGFGAWGLLSRDVGRTVVNSDDQVITSYVAGESADQLIIDEPLFKMTLPGGWKLEKKDETPRKVYYFRLVEESASNGGKTLVMYIDGTMDVYPVNRIVPVSAQGSKLSVGQVSDTCSQFTGPGGNSRSGTTIAKWQNISFMCDLSHMNRNAIGISSADGVNQVAITGAKGGTHRYFMIYTDHNNRPDNNAFTKILSSFEAK